LAAALTRHGCRDAFSPIVTQRGEVLHGVSADVALEEGRLLLVDAGAEEPGGYTSDMTRTFPVSGDWSDIQGMLYRVVLGAQQAAIGACVVGARYRDVHHLAARHITSGLIEADLLRGDPDALFERGAYGLFFCHGVGHLLGLGVHDMEDFGDLAGYAPGRTRSKRFGDNFLRLDRDLQAGMAVTIEPGLYLVPEIWAREDLSGPFADVVNRNHVDKLLAERFGGIRIEEDIIVQADGAPEILTADLPNDPDAITAVMRSGD
jgi:Xaa-Pro aminopeptidase